MGRLKLVMMMMAFLQLSIFKAAVEAQTPYGQPTNNHPSYFERTTGALANAARVGPDGYAQNYLPLSGYWGAGAVTGAQMAPVYFDSVLSGTSSSHSEDLATNCHVLQYSSCDSTPWYTRIEDVYSCSSEWLTEAIEYTFSTDPLSTVNMNLCSPYTDSNGNTVCCPANGETSSGAYCSAMRDTMFSSSPTRFGVGVAGDTFYNGVYYWTWDYGSCNTQLYTNLIYSGSHLIQGSNIRFFATYYDPTGQAPQTSQVVIDGTSYALQLDTGTFNQGNYYHIGSATGSCRSYYFLFTTPSGGSFRYPEAGYFNTYNDGSCVTDWTSTPIDVTTVPSAPYGLSVSAITDTSALISWSAPITDGGSTITRYMFYISYYGNTFGYSIQATAMNYGDLLPGTSVTVYVAAFNSVGSSPNSSLVTFITSAATPTPNPNPSPSSTPSPTNPVCNDASCLPTSFDWHQQTGCFTGIYNQQQCGSCYCFSTAAANSDRQCHWRGLSVVLSPQEILDCGAGSVWPGASGCDGGYTNEAQSFVYSHGLPSASSTALNGGCRSYTCASGTCPNPIECPSTCDDGSSETLYKASADVAQIIGVTNIMLEIYNNGPVTATWNVYDNFYTFFSLASNHGQVYTGPCSSSTPNYVGGHAVSIVGWGVDPNGIEFWLIQNSWGISWGDSGFYRMQRGVDLCGIEDFVTSGSWSGSGKRFGAMSLSPRSSAPAVGTLTSSDSSNGLVSGTAQFALDLWQYTNFRDSVNNISLTPPSSKRQAGSFGVLTASGDYSVTGINSATTQVTSGQTVFVDFIASNGIESVNLVSTVSYSAAAAAGAASSSTVTVASSRGGAALSTGAIIGIAIGGAAGVVIIAGLGAAAVFGTVAIYRRNSAGDFYTLNNDEHAQEMEAQAQQGQPRKSKRSTWFERRKLFQSITGRSPPVEVLGKSSIPYKALSDL